MITPEELEARRRERNSKRRHAAIVGFSTGVIGGAVAVMLITAVVVWLR